MSDAVFRSIAVMPRNRDALKRREAALRLPLTFYVPDRAAKADYCLAGSDSVFTTLDVGRALALTGPFTCDAT